MELCKGSLGCYDVALLVSLKEIDSTAGSIHVIVNTMFVL